MYICEIDPARTRYLGDEPLPEDGLGNAEYNADWDRYDYASRIRNVVAHEQTLLWSTGEEGLTTADRGSDRPVWLGKRRVEDISNEIFANAQHK
ncbi:kinesin domain-containing protein [Moniliophthora roreri]|nr:kinesin domain-containing protein [Moniliophthora roreri]